jgi:hypothetical protein
MGTKVTVPGPERLALEQQALQSVLASPTFKKNARATSLLEYICGKYFNGDGDSIKEYSIAVDVFHRSESFDQATDSIVRVEFYRLRRKLREYYETASTDERLEIVVPTGRYLPEFLDRNQDRPPTDSFPEPELSLLEDDQEPVPKIRFAGVRKLVRNNLMMLWLVLATGGFLASVWMWWRVSGRANAILSSATTSVTEAAPVAGKAVRIRCGYTRPLFKDQEGNEWLGDRYFTGGFGGELADQHIERTRDPQIYLTLRSGTFSYNIPLASGTYELRLHFAETTYTPSSSLGGGENSRVFDIRMNGRPLLTQFDIVSDAGPDTADVRVFKDVQPGPDGHLHLDFSGVLGQPMINAIEILPGKPHRLLPIRIVAQNSFVVDKAGNLWNPDAYFSGGQLATDKTTITGTDEPALYAGERYGNFSYALPADDGTYALTIYMSEKYWGTAISKKGGAGSRVFDVFCNGVALARNLDIAKQAGSGVAFKKTFHGLHPNAQGKLLVSLVPDINYAAIDAIEVEEEQP